MTHYNNKKHSLVLITSRLGCFSLAFYAAMLVQSKRLDWAQTLPSFGGEKAGTGCSIPSLDRGFLMNPIKGEVNWV